MGQGLRHRRPASDLRLRIRRTPAGTDRPPGVRGEPPSKARLRQGGLRPRGDAAARTLRTRRVPRRRGDGAATRRVGGARPHTVVGVPLTTILGLPERLAAMTGGARERASRLADARLVEADTDPPPELHEWLAETFGSVEAVRRQTIVKV